MEEADNLGVEQPSDFGDQQDPVAIQKRFSTEVRLAKKREDAFRRRAKEATQKYTETDRMGDDEDAKFALFWSNVETLKPTLYARAPKLEISRRHKDRDPTSLTGSLILERSAGYYYESEQFDVKARAAIQDYLISGRGIIWQRYHAEKTLKELRVDLTMAPDGSLVVSATGEVFIPEAAEVELQEDERGIFFIEQYEDLASEEVIHERVKYSDFLHADCSNWEQCGWVARRVFMRKDEAIAFFDEEAAERIKYQFIEGSADKELQDEENEETKSAFRRAELWEIWCKESNQVYWIQLGQEKIIDASEPPLRLKGFFPCAMPLLATLDGESLIPKSDYHLYKGQCGYIDELTVRIELLTSALAVRGVRDAQYEELDRLLDDAAENDIIPVKNWSQFMQEGGLDKLVQMFPLETIANTLKMLIDLRNEAEQNIYRITGIGDIIRGSSDPMETATAQRLKGQYMNNRLSERQKAVQAWIRDNIRITCEIIAEQFDDNTIALLCGARYLDDTEKQAYPEALTLIRDDILREFAIDIETDSTLAIDQDRQKEEGIEVMQTFGKFLEQAAKSGQLSPSMLLAMKAIAMFAVRRVKGGRQLEGEMETAFEQMAQQAAQPRPNPKAMEAQQKAQAKLQEAQAKLQLEQAKMQMEIEFKKRELELKAQLEREKMQMEFEQKTREAIADQQAEVVKQQIRTEGEVRKSQQDIPVLSPMN